jgi:hypothetical protein
LGLAIVQSIVSDHHGTISVSSEEGHGTTFRMELPKRQANTPEVRTEEPRTAPGSAKDPNDAKESKDKDAPPTFAAASD